MLSKRKPTLLKNTREKQGELRFTSLFPLTVMFQCFVPHSVSFRSSGDSKDSNPSPTAQTDKDETLVARMNQLMKENEIKIEKPLRIVSESSLDASYFHLLLLHFLKPLFLENTSRKEK